MKLTPQEWTLIDRFKEPSSWASLAAACAAAGMTLPSGIVHAVSLIGSGVCVALGIVLKEKSSNKVDA